MSGGSSQSVVSNFKPYEHSLSTWITIFRLSVNWPILCLLSKSVVADHYSSRYHKSRFSTSPFLTCHRLIIISSCGMLHVDADTVNLSDKTIVSLSPLLDRIVDGTFHSLEQAAGVVPFTIQQEEEFTKTWTWI